MTSVHQGRIQKACTARCKGWDGEGVRCRSFDVEVRGAKRANRDAECVEGWESGKGLPSPTDYEVWGDS